MRHYRQRVDRRKLVVVKEDGIAGEAPGARNPPAHRRPRVVPMCARIVGLAEGEWLYAYFEKRRQAIWFVMEEYFND